MTVDSSIQAAISKLGQHPDVGPRIRSVITQDAVSPTYASPSHQLSTPVLTILKEKGIQYLYSHQAMAIDSLMDGQSTTIVTGTASGKTLCYTVPIAECIYQRPQTTVLALYPTKALTSDQLKGFRDFQRPDIGVNLYPGVFDGDSSASQRSAVIEKCNVVLSNPDMLHSGILPNHPRWHRFFENLSYVVVDEIHMYRGHFGSHMANVIARLVRICRHYGSAPVFAACSATLANSQEHAEAICGAKMHLVKIDGAGKGERVYVFIG